MTSPVVPSDGVVRCAPVLSRSSSSTPKQCGPDAKCDVVDGEWLAEIAGREDVLAIARVLGPAMWLCFEQLGNARKVRIGGLVS